MGNWGNTLDRWYHRAAVIVWPREQAFANRAETSPAWALDQLAAMASAGDVAGTRAAAATLAPFWDSIPGGRMPEDQSRIRTIFGPALKAAGAISDAQTAAMLLRPFHIGYLDRKYAGSFGKIAGRYSRCGRRNCCGRGSAWASPTGGMAAGWNGRGRSPRC